RSIPADREVLFCPDQFLGAHVKRVTGRSNISIWAGECHVHAGISPADVRAQVAAHPDAEILVHPECGCTTSVLDLVSHGDLPADRTRVLSTGGMVAEAAATSARQVLVATEIGILHQLRGLNSRTDFIPMNARAACRYMKMITPAKLLHTLRTGEGAVDVDPSAAARARKAVEAMIAIGEPGRGGE
ncbi:MAG: nadA, partial [Modestobacter sp.]|nr:nadA [Modestobacter sp.]